MPNDVHVTIFATSLDTGSRSQILARHALTQLESQGVSATLIDLRDWDLPFGGAAAVETSEAVHRLKQETARATHLLFAVPVYNWDVNAAAKNLIEILTGHELSDKTVGFLCAAGGQSSYMSVLSFANSLMLDFRCWIVPRFVYAVGSDFEGDTISNPKIAERIDGLIEAMLGH